MATPLPQPKHVLLQILVSSDLTATVRSYYEGTLASIPVSVNVGDRVAFLVQLQVGGRKTVPYEITFANAHFFGQTSLTVPHGGLSPFLTVLILAGRTSYGLNMPGFGCIFDPEIQSGSDGGSATVETIKHAEFLITWDTAANSISYTSSLDAHGAGWPIFVNLLDKVSFAVVGIGVSAASIVFAPNQNAWATPFTPEDSVLKLPSLHAGPFVVNDSFEGDPGTLFPFHGSATVNSAPLISPSYSISLK